MSVQKSLFKKITSHSEENTVTLQNHNCRDDKKVKVLSTFVVFQCNFLPTFVHEYFKIRIYIIYLIYDLSPDNLFIS